MDSSKARCSAFDRAVNYLSFKDRTRKEICDKLKEKGYGTEEIDVAVSKLMEYGYINDQGYALSYIRAHINKKGKKLIKTELVNKGISREIVECCFYECDIDEYETIDSIIRRRYADVDFKDDKILRRIYGYLLRRGFDYGSINSALNNYRYN